LQWIALLLLILPGALLSSGLLAGKLQGLWLLDRFGIGDWVERISPAGALLCVGMVLRFIYLPLRLLDEGMRRIDPACLEAALMAGHGRSALVVGILIPQLRSYWLAAGLMVFVLSLGELVLAARLAAPGAIPASLLIFNQQHNGYQEGVFGQSLALGLLGLLAALILLWIWREHNPRKLTL
jgi:ABC-type Fe3+ transport system permease subunit